VNTLEQSFIHRRLVEQGIKIRLNTLLSSVSAKTVSLSCSYTGASSDMATDAVVLVTSRRGDDGLWRDLQARAAEWDNHGIQSVKLIGDAASPAPIAWATYAGHRYASELDSEERGDALPFRREVAQLAKD
jgi:dimethylamine/trimethylamine dehydrogenase